MYPTIRIPIRLQFAKSFVVLLKIVHSPYVYPETQGNNNMSSSLEHHATMVLPAILNCNGLVMSVKEAIVAPAIR